MMRRPGVMVLWAVVGCGVALEVGLHRLWDPPPSSSRPWTAPEHEAQQRLARKAVDAVVAEIGGDLSIDEVEVVPLESPMVASYEARHRRIAFSPQCDVEASALLTVAAHECVHALFDRECLPLPGDGVEHRRVEEATAQVLGAMLAGRVVSRRGGDGEALTREMLESYRAMCDSSSPRGVRQTVERAVAVYGENAFDREKLDDAEAHFPDVKQVDQVIEICRANPDPRAAIRGVHRAFFGEWSENDLFAMKYFGQRIPTPVAEETPTTSD